jgi:hypothetical protein
MIEETQQRLRDFIAQSGAFIAVVATETPLEILNGGDWKAKAPWAANIVLTMSRNGPSFGSFFHRIFRSMYEGTTFAQAWNEAAPQISGLDHSNAPGTVCLVEAGSVSFKDQAGTNLERIAPEAMRHLSLSFQKDGGFQLRAAEVALQFVVSQELEPNRSHLETILSHLGALAGYGCQVATRHAVASGRIKLASNQAPFMEAVGKDGRKYYLGGLLNEFLGEASVSVWGIISFAIRGTGGPLPDVRKIIAHSAGTIGGKEFEVLMLEAAHQPREHPCRFLGRTASNAFNLLGQLKSDPLYVGWQFALAARKLIIEKKDIFPPTLAGQIFMESAVMASKLDPQRLTSTAPASRKASSGPPAFLRDLDDRLGHLHEAGDGLRPSSPRRRSRTPRRQIRPLPLTKARPSRNGRFPRQGPGGVGNGGAGSVSSGGNGQGTLLLS